MTMLSRLLNSLHSAVFDKSPDEVLAFRVRHANGVSWSIADELLTARVGDLAFQYPLAQMTVGQLAGQMLRDGFDVEGMSSEMAGLSASVLVEGNGDSRKSNGDRIYGFTNLVYSLLGGFSRELRAAKAQIPEALKQMVITSSEGEWLDLWGKLYNYPRVGDVPDPTYSKAIPEEAFRIRVNAFAIEKAIFDITGKVVHIEEPWEEIFRLDYSKLSGGHKFYDGSTVGYHLIRPVADAAIDWTGIFDIIERNKAAGVLVLPPEEHNRLYNADPLDGTIWFRYDDFRGLFAAVWDPWRLDATLILSDSKPIINYRVMTTHSHLLTNWRTATWWERKKWNVDPWAKLYVPMSLLDPFTISYHTNIRATGFAFANLAYDITRATTQWNPTSAVWPAGDDRTFPIQDSRTNSTNTIVFDMAASMTVNSYDSPDWLSTPNWGDVTWEG